MARQNRPLNKFGGQCPAIGSAGAFVDLLVPSGDRIYWTLELYLRCAGYTFSQFVSKIELLIGGRDGGEEVVRTYNPGRTQERLKSYSQDGSDRWAIQNFDVLSGTSLFPIHFYEPWRDTPGTRKLWTLPTGNVGNLKVRVWFVDNLLAVPTFTAAGLFERGTANLRQMVKIYEDTVDVVGDTKMYDAYKVGGSLEEVIFFDVPVNGVIPNTSISKLNWTYGSVLWLEEFTKLKSDGGLIRDRMTPSEKMFPVCFDNNDSSAEDPLANRDRLHTTDLTFNAGGVARNLIAVSRQIGPITSLQ